MTESEKYMTEALAEAEKALAAGEVPIGAVMVRNGEIIARMHYCYLLCNFRAFCFSFVFTSTGRLASSYSIKCYYFVFISK